MRPRRQRLWLRRNGPRLAAVYAWTILLITLPGMVSPRALAQPSSTDSTHPIGPDPSYGLRPLVVGFAFEPELVRHQARFDVGGCPGEYLPGFDAGTRLGLFGIVGIPWRYPLLGFASIYWRDISTRLVSSSYAEEARNEFSGAYDTVTIHTRFDATITGVGAARGLAWS